MVPAISNSEAAQGGPNVIGETVQHTSNSGPAPGTTLESKVRPDDHNKGLDLAKEHGVRNMGNFNLFKTHVLTFFHHVEQCCYPSFLIDPHIPAMTSHVAYVIHAIFTLITTQGLCNITFLPYVFLSLMHLGPYFSYVPYHFSFLLIHVALLTLYRIRNQVYLSTRNCSRLNVILEGFLKTTENLIANLRAHPHLYANPIAQLRGVDTQVSSDDPMGIVRKNTANDLREIWRRPFPNTNCWNRKSLHSFRNRERLRTPYRIRLEKATRES